MTILVRAPEEKKTYLQNEAQKIGLTLNALMLIIIDDWIKQREKEKYQAED